MSLDVISFSAAMLMYRGGGLWQRVAPLFVEVSIDTLFPNVIIFNAAISARKKHRQWQRAVPLSTETPYGTFPR
eukprot:6090-Karenia_brevis.AAC.1